MRQDLIGPVPFHYRLKVQMEWQEKIEKKPFAKLKKISLKCDYGEKLFHRGNCTSKQYQIKQSASMGVGRGAWPLWILKILAKKFVFLVSSGKKQILPLLAPIKKFLKNPLVLPPWKKILPTPMSASIKVLPGVFDFWSIFIIQPPLDSIYLKYKSKWKKKSTKNFLKNWKNFQQSVAYASMWRVWDHRHGQGA